MSAPRSAPHRIDPDAGIPDLIRRLTDDSKRLAADEVRLAKLEMTENVHAGARGALWLAVAFGVGVVGLVGATIFLATLIGRLANGNMWVGALATGAIELVLAAVLFKKGIGSFSGPSYTLQETRAALRDTGGWVRQPRAD